MLTAGSANREKILPVQHNFVMNIDWWKADQLDIYKCDRGELNSGLQIPMPASWSFGNAVLSDTKFLTFGSMHRTLKCNHSLESC